MDTLVGRRLGKYQIEALVGRGGMATVYRAHDTALNRSVAIKVLDPALSIDPKAVERFRREAVTAANLEHPSIVRVYDVEQSGTLHYIAMRYVQGTTLREVLRDNGPLPLDAVLNIIKPIASALHYAHTHGVIHRDVKPGNILVEPDGTVLLTDFGIARAGDASQSSLTATGHVMGTADYLAPEQISGRPAEARSDVYSLGVVLYEMLTGVTPFSGENTANILYKQVHDNPPPLRSINPRLPNELQPLLDRALAKNPTLRYADPTDLVRELEDIVAWMPPGSPWLGKRGAARPGVAALQGQGQYGQQGQHPPSVQNGNANAVRRGQGTVAVGATTGPQPRPATRPHQQGYDGAGPYVEGSHGSATAAREVIAPLREARAFPVMLIAALLLIVAGGVVLGFATGFFGGLGRAGDGVVRFKAPGAPSFSGPTRKANGADIGVPQALAAPTIDGQIEDWAGASPGPYEAPHITARVKGGRDWSGPDDLSASFLFAWDSDNFYIGAVVTDNVHVQFQRTRGYDLYKGDDLEFWFDLDLGGDFATQEGNGDDFQLGLSPGDFATLAPEAVFWNPDRSAERNKMVRVAALPREGTGGYTLEAAVPWAAFGSFRPHEGTVIGFAASAGDNDQSGTPVQELMISTAPTLQYKRPPTFGNMYF